jgi:hypothetical protein
MRRHTNPLKAILIVTFIGLTGGNNYAQCDPSLDLSQPYNTDECTILLLHFDGDSGNIAHDVSSHGNDGTIYGAEWISSGRFDGALYFDGYADEGGDSLKIYLSDVSFMAGPHTLEAWIYPLNIGTQHTILSLYGGHDQIPMYILSDGRVSFRVVHDSPDYHEQILSTTHLQANNWYHVAGIWDGCEMAIYVNGCKENSKTLSYSPSIPPRKMLDFGKVWTAASTPNGARSFFNGYIDEVRISSIARAFSPIAPICYAFLTAKKINIGAGYAAKPFPVDNPKGKHDFKIHIIPCEPMNVSVGDSADVFVDADKSGSFDNDENYLAIVSSTDLDGQATDIAIKVYMGKDLINNDPCVAIYSINNIPIVDSLCNKIDYLCLETFDPHKGLKSTNSETSSLISLSQNYPNPFNPETEISYTLTQDNRVKLVIYNVKGQKVKVLVDEYQSAGYNSIKWDGKDEKGSSVASGVYFYRLSLGNKVKTKKMLLLK